MVLVEEEDLADMWDEIRHSSSLEGNDDLVLDMGRKWQSRKKTARSIPVINVFSEIREDIPEELIRSLTGLDVKINCYDDTIDSNLDKEQKVRYEKTKDLANSLMHFNRPESWGERRDGEYRNQLFQIPAEESKYMQKMIQAEEREEIIEMATECYRARSKVVDGFVDLASEFYDLTNRRKEQIKEDMRSFIGRKQIVKDIRPEEVKKDLEDSDLGPSAKLISKFNDLRNVETAVREVYDALDYSGNAEYSETLDQLEPTIENLRQYLSESESVIKQYAIN